MEGNVVRSLKDGTNGISTKIEVITKTVNSTELETRKIVGTKIEDAYHATQTEIGNGADQISNQIKNSMGGVEGQVNGLRGVIQNQTQATKNLAMVIAENDAQMNKMMSATNADIKRLQDQSTLPQPSSVIKTPSADVTEPPATNNVAPGTLEPVVVKYGKASPSYVKPFNGFLWNVRTITRGQRSRKIGWKELADGDVCVGSQGPIMAHVWYSNKGIFHFGKSEEDVPVQIGKVTFVDVDAVAFYVHDSPSFDLWEKIIPPQ